MGELGVDVLAEEEIGVKALTIDVLQVNMLLGVDTLAVNVLWVSVLGIDILEVVVTGISIGCQMPA